jgi:hypothetical protein
MAIYGILADVVVLIHVAFVGFVVFGWFASWRWFWVSWIHLPAVFWGIGIEWAGAICPLTLLENLLRNLAGQPNYKGDFLAQLFEAILYPQGLTRMTQLILGTLVLAINTAAYARLWRCRCRLSR